jgi:hypothetical protein
MAAAGRTRSSMICLCGDEEKKTFREIKSPFFKALTSSQEEQQFATPREWGPQMNYCEDYLRERQRERQSERERERKQL